MKIFASKTKVANKNKKLDEELDDQESGEVSQPSILDGITFLSKKESTRSVGLFGPVDSVKVAHLIGALLDLSEPDEEIKIVDSDDDVEDVSSAEKIVTDGVLSSSDELLTSGVTEEPERLDPIEFIINTPGGEADEMFALYDVMRQVKTKCDIETYGLGKVMSAGVLILAAGTKGKRKIGKHCRVMIHTVMAGSVGSLHNLENEIKEIKLIQQSYLKALSLESGMPMNKLQKMINKRVNVYLSAEEAVELGIADIIV
jgi:ATP-dependent Clp protease protease subunit